MQLFILNDYEKAGWVAGYQCCISIYSFIAFGLILVGVYHQTGLVDRTPVFYADWSQHLIQDISYNTTCTSSQINMLNWTWPGTQAGCDCTNAISINGSDFTYNGYYYQACNDFQKSQKCLDVAQIQPQQFNTWPFLQNSGQPGNLLMCGTPSTMTMQSAYKPNQAVVPNYKLCGTQIQVPINEQCPISTIIFTNNQTGIRVLDWFYYFTTSITSNQQAMSGFTVNFNNVCYSKGNISSFQYLDNFINYNCTQNDSRYIQSTQFNTSQYWHLLTSNGLNSTYLNTFTKSSFLTQCIYFQTIEINLFSKQFTQFNYGNDCALTDQNFIADLKQYNQNMIYGIQLTSEIMVGIQAGVFGFLIPFIAAISMVGCEFTYLQLDKKDEGYKDVFKFWLAAKLFSELLCTIILICNYAYQSYMLRYIQNFINYGCTDVFTASDLQYFHDQFTSSVHYYILLDFVLCLIVFLLDSCVTYAMFKDKEDPCRKSVIIHSNLSKVMEQNAVYPDSVKQKFSDREIQVEKD